MKRLRIIASTLTVISILALNSIGASAEWRQTYDGDKALFYYEEGESRATGWRYIGKNWYYLDATTGFANTGWKNMDGKWYYFEPTGIMAQSLITPNYYKEDNGVYYLNSDGVYVENPPEEIQAYINLIKNRELLLKLKIIEDGTRGFGGQFVEQKRTIESDCIIQDITLDNDKDGILEMYIGTRFGKNFIVKYSRGNINVYDYNYNFISSTDTTNNVDTSKVLSSGLTLKEAKIKIDLTIAGFKSLGETVEENMDYINQLCKSMGTTYDEVKSFQLGANAEANNKNYQDVFKN